MFPVLAAVGGIVVLGAYLTFSQLSECESIHSGTTNHATNELGSK